MLPPKVCGNPWKCSRFIGVLTCECKASHFLKCLQALKEPILADTFQSGWSSLFYYLFNVMHFNQVGCNTLYISVTLTLTHIFRLYLKISRGTSGQPHSPPPPHRWFPPSRITTGSIPALFVDSASRGASLIGREKTLRKEGNVWIWLQVSSDTLSIIMSRF